MTHFSELSEADAVLYLQHVIVREPLRLVDLAHHLHAVGGPIERMDGTVASLGELWPWFLEQLARDVPGIPSAASGSPALALGSSSEPGGVVRRGQYLAEAIGHYVASVVRGSAPEARWGHPQRERFRQLDDGIPCLIWRSSAPWPLERYMAASVRRALSGAESFLAPDSLERATTTVLVRSGIEDFGDRGPSILALLLSTPAAPPDDPRRIPPIFVPSAPVPALPATASIDLELAPFRALGPHVRMDPVPLLALLERLGVHDRDGRPIDMGGLLAGRDYLIGDDWMDVFIDADASGILSVGFLSLLLPAAEWDAIEPVLEAYAEHHGLHLGEGQE